MRGRALAPAALTQVWLCQDVQTQLWVVPLRPSEGGPTDGVHWETASESRRSPEGFLCPSSQLTPPHLLLFCCFLPSFIEI